MATISSFPVDVYIKDVPVAGKGELRIQELDKEKNKICVVAKYKYCEESDNKGYIAEVHLFFDLDAFKIWLRQCEEEVNV